MLLFDYCIANLTHAHVIAGRPRGFGHIDFKSEELAKKAISVLNGVMLQGRELRVDLAQRRDAGAVGTPFAPRSFGSESDARPPRREKFQSSAGPRDQVRGTSAPPILSLPYVRGIIVGFFSIPKIEPGQGW